MCESAVETKGVEKSVIYVGDSRARARNRTIFEPPSTTPDSHSVGAHFRGERASRDVGGKKARRKKVV